MTDLTIHIHEHFAAIKRENASLFSRLNDVQLTTEFGADVKLIFNGELRPSHKELLNDENDSPFHVTHMEGKCAWVTVPADWKDGTTPAPKATREQKAADIVARIKAAFGAARGGSTKDIEVEPVSSSAKLVNEWRIKSTKPINKNGTFDKHGFERVLFTSDKTMVFTVPTHWLPEEPQAVIAALGENDAPESTNQDGEAPVNPHELVSRFKKQQKVWRVEDNEPGVITAVFGGGVYAVEFYDGADADPTDPLYPLYTRTMTDDELTDTDPNPQQPPKRDTTDDARSKTTPTSAMDTLETVELPPVVEALAENGTPVPPANAPATTEDDVIPDWLAKAVESEAPTSAALDLMREERDAAIREADALKAKDERLASGNWTIVEVTRFNAVVDKAATDALELELARDQIAALQAQIARLTETNNKQSDMLKAVSDRPIERRVVAQYIPTNGHTSIALKEVEKAEREGWRIVARNVAPKDGQGIYYLHELQRFAPEAPEPVKPVGNAIEQAADYLGIDDDPIADGTDLDAALEPELSAAEAALDELNRYYKNPPPTIAPPPLVIEGKVYRG